MRFRSAIAALMLAGVLAGCAGASVGVRTGGSTAVGSKALSPGGSYSAVSIQAHGRPSAFFGLLLFAPVVFGMDDDYRQTSAWPSARRVPEMAEGRAIAERDCSQPLGQIEGNLRCR